jgi:hypothetical protein
MTTVVISQPMFFPWVGMLEQVRLADVFVHYDDVQFSKGSFTNRVQIKTGRGSRWLTVPLPGLRLGQEIREVRLAPVADWQASHLDMLKQAYAGAPHVDEMLRIVRDVYARPHVSLAELGVASLEALCRYFGVGECTRFVHSSALGVPGASDDRVLAIVRRFGGDRYVTGHGARNYLDHEMFEREGVRVEYLDYQRTRYGQLHGEFTPFVSALDLVANEGVEGRRVIASPAVPWREFLGRGSDDAP